MVELSGIRGMYEGPWELCGDYNVTRYLAERAKCHRISSAMTEYSTWIDDLVFFGSSLIWRILHSVKGGNHTSFSRTNRFLYSTDWEENFLSLIFFRSSRV